MGLLAPLVDTAKGSLSKGRRRISAVGRRPGRRVARNIRVNAVNPGLVKTEGMAGFANGHFEKGAVAATPLFI